MAGVCLTDCNIVCAVSEYPSEQRDRRVALMIHIKYIRVVAWHGMAWCDRVTEKGV